MPQTLKLQRAGLPYNPGLRGLVDGKRQTSSSIRKDQAKSGFRGWHERGYLPHRDAPNLIQFVTFRLKDSFPEALRSEWEHLLSLEDDQERRQQLEAYLDKGRGSCHLRKSPVAKLVEEALRLFHGDRYELQAWVIMPNHVHVLFKTGDTPMAKIVESWKKYTGKKANKLIGHQGAFWEADYWDTYMRNEEHGSKTRRYIEGNPAKAGLVLDPKDWPWSSARFRDEYGALQL